jgi:hypothetical protein
MAASGKSSEGIDANVNRASKLMRLFNERVGTKSEGPMGPRGPVSRKRP